MTRADLLISADALHAALGAPDLRIVDASWYLPAQGRNAKAEFAEGHIPGAVFFDQDAVVDPESTLPHTFPPADVFARAAGALGISEHDDIVVYDGLGLFSSPRVAWLFKAFGAGRVRVLEGGLDRWKAAGRPVTDAASMPKPANFNAALDERRVLMLDAMRAVVDAGRSQVADARAPGRFEGREPEPRAGVRSGHMPGARNVYFADLLANGALKPDAELRAVFDKAGIDLGKPVVTSCGSGVTASVITLALDALGHSSHALYDGSWTEWGGRTDTPVVTGPAA